MVKFSNKLGKIDSYVSADIDGIVKNLKAQGKEVFDFGVGSPPESPPLFIQSSMIKAITENRDAGYPDYIGSKKFRETVAQWFERRFNIQLDSESEVTISLGSKEATVHFAHSLVENSEDIVLIPTPSYPSYESGTIFANGCCYYFPLTKKNNFLPNLSDIPAEIRKKVKLIWINYPNNPTTVIASNAFYKELIEFANKNEIVIASDECYSEIYFSKEKPKSILEFSKDKENIIVFNSLSKRSNMPNYRIGFAVGDKRLISCLRKIKARIDSGHADFIQEAAIIALKDEEHVERKRQEYRKKRDIIVEAFVNSGLKKCEPEATFYIWQEIPQEYSSVEFAKLLLEQTGIVSIPGGYLSKPINRANIGDRYIRIALVPSFEECKKSAERIRNLKF